MKGQRTSNEKAFAKAILVIISETRLTIEEVNREVNKAVNKVVNKEVNEVVNKAVYN